MSTATAVNGSSNADLYASLNGSSGTKASDTASADRFLTMLVTQLKNQDPLNPMDNAQVTSQMAQINAVAGLEKVNESIKTLGTQMLQLQTMQGAALVGRDVTLPGNTLAIDTDNVGRGVVELPASANTTVQVLDGSSNVVATIPMGNQDAGRHAFAFDASKLPTNSDYTFRVVATSGKQTVQAGTLMLDRVQSVSTGSSGMTLNLARSGSVSASDVVAFN